MTPVDNTSLSPCSDLLRTSEPVFSRKQPPLYFSSAISPTTNWMNCLSKLLRKTRIAEHLTQCDNIHTSFMHRFTRISNRIIYKNCCYLINYCSRLYYDITLIKTTENYTRENSHIVKLKLCQWIQNTQVINSWDADSFSPSQQYTSLLWSSKVHYRVHKSPPVDPNLSHINSCKS